MPRKNRTPKHQPFVDTNTCRLKRRFASQEKAEAAVEIQSLQGVPLSAYKCDRCTGWHLTRKEKPAR